MRSGRSAWRPTSSAAAATTRPLQHDDGLRGALCTTSVTHVEPPTGHVDVFVLPRLDRRPAKGAGAPGGRGSRDYPLAPVVGLDELAEPYLRARQPEEQGRRVDEGLGPR